MHSRQLSLIVQQGVWPLCSSSSYLYLALYLFYIYLILFVVFFAFLDFCLCDAKPQDILIHSSLTCSFSFWQNKLFEFFHMFLWMNCLIAFLILIKVALKILSHTISCLLAFCLLYLLTANHVLFYIARSVMGSCRLFILLSEYVVYSIFRVC